MTDLNIKVTELETGETKDVDTEGYLLLYLENDKIKMTGKLDIKVLAPLLTKMALEKLSR